jgi:hypothetical protein
MGRTISMGSGTYEFTRLGIGAEADIPNGIDVNEGEEMKRISIRWDNTNIYTDNDVLRGVVTICEGDAPLDVAEAGSFRVDIRKHSIGMRGMNGGFLPPEYEEYRDILHIMVESYYAGLTHKPDLYHWIIEEEQT